MSIDNVTFAAFSPDLKVPLILNVQAQLQDFFWVDLFILNIKWVYFTNFRSKNNQERD